MAFRCAFFVSVLLALQGAATAKRLTEWRGEETDTFFNCPRGLEKVNGTCTDGVVAFAPGGTINAQALVTEKVAAAVEDASFSGRIISEIKGLWEKRRGGFKEKLHSFGHAVHVWEEALKPAVFVAEHGLEYVLIHEIVHGLHVAGKLAHYTHNEALVHGIEGISTVAETIGEVIHTPFMIGIQALLVWEKTQIASLRTMEDSARSALAMRLKADCLSERLWAPESKTFPFRSEVAEICGPDAQATLAEDMHRANRALLSAFQAFGDIGSCLYPAGGEGMRDEAKVECVQAVVPKLRVSHGKMGLLYSAIGLAKVYSGMADQLLQEPRYGDLVANLYHLPRNASGQLAPEQDIIPLLVNMSAQSDDMQALSCLSLVANQRAFAETFETLALAARTWMRTYARRLLEPSVWTSWRPCQKVINRMDEAENGMCKTQYAADMAMQSVTCANAFSTYIWKRKGH